MIKKILIIFTIVLLTISTIYTIYFQVDAFSVSSRFSGDVSQVSEAKDATLEIIGTVLSVIRTAAAGVAIIILLVIGCKYMLASAGDRADIKKYAINYVIGAFILFGATALVSIAKIFIDSAFSATE